jgi:hypothetical protein
MLELAEIALIRIGPSGASKHPDQSALCIVVAVDVALSGLDGSMTDELLDIP